MLIFTMTVVDDSIVSGASKSARISRTGIRLKLGSAERTAVHIYEVQRAKGTEAERRGSWLANPRKRAEMHRLAHSEAIRGTPAGEADATGGKNEIESR